MRDTLSFEHIIRSETKLSDAPVQNLADLIFNPLDHRSEKAEVILGHDGKQFLRISLKRFRYIHLQLYKNFREKNIRRGETLLLAGVPGNNEMYQALLFSALSSYGVRVLMPMFMETGELESWLSVCNCTSAIIPGREIHNLNHHDKAKAVVDEIDQKVRKQGLPVYDTLQSFEIRQFMYSDISEMDFSEEPIVADIIQETNRDQEGLIITTSGSTGRSKLVVYLQDAFIKSCLSWQTAGLLHENILGGRGFTPLFTHTMGIRTFFNALWTGNPVCLINTEWFEEYPEIVRYFLLKMKPEHITGGPAAFKLLLEMTRNFPELIPVFRIHFKTLVSSGAPFDSEMVRELQSTFELPVRNALGTTETQQVTNTLLSGSNGVVSAGDIGTPLPGVTLGLAETGYEDHYRLFVKSPFGCHTILNDGEESHQDGYFCSGDIVELKKGRMIYAGRDGKDFFKDGFGVKIPVKNIREYYRELGPETIYTDFFTLQGEPGLAALVFLKSRSVGPGVVTDKKVVAQYKERFGLINNGLFRDLSPFEYRHRAVRRFVIIHADPPKTVKGNVSQKRLQQKYARLIQALRKYFVSEKWIHSVKSQQLQFDAFTEHANSYAGRYLRDLKMDLVYHRAEKDSLFAYSEGKEIEVLDVVGGYGVNLIGHNHPALRNVMKEFVDRGAVSISNQGSIQNEVGLLAEKLNAIMERETGRSFRVLLGSTGAEAVEMALHHACLEWRKKMEKLEQLQLRRFGSENGAWVRKIWDQNRSKIASVRLGVISLSRSFHGHSSAARSLIGKNEQRSKFTNLLSLDAFPIDDTQPGWRKQLDQSLTDAHIELTVLKRRKGRIQPVIKKFSTIIAAIAEPIAGEGGVREVNRDALHHLANFEFPLILDEIQSGLGRSGEFLASKGVSADYYLLGKSLGGGLEKISAVLVEKNRYIDQFGKYYTTTFGNGELAARVAREMLSLIDSLNIPELAHNRGERLKKQLAEVVDKYPGVFESVSGRGLMLGIRFADFSTPDNILLRLMYKREFLGYVCASYLLNRHHIRILPTLSAPNVLRVEPSVFITDKEIDQLAEALESLAGIIESRSLYELFLHFMEGDPFDDQKGYKPPNGMIYPGIDPPQKGATQVTFLAHFTYPTDELRILESSFKRASDTGLRLLFNHLQVLMEMKPVTLFSKNIFDERVHFQMKIIPLGSAELERMHREGKKAEIIGKIQQAVDEAAREGSEIVALGAYTSIFTNNGLALVEPKQTKIISGNTLTAASGIARLMHELESRPAFTGPFTLGVVGAAGNIGKAVSAYMANHNQFFKKIILIVHHDQQKNLLERHLQKTPRVEIHYSTDIESLKKCDVCVVTTNTNNPLVFPQHLKTGSPVLILDNSVPSSLSEEVNKLDNVSVIPFSSYLKLPLDPEFVISSHTPKGSAFCCAVEAMLCALEEINIPLRGELDESSIEFTIRVAEKWGLFSEFGTVKSFKSDAKV